MRRGHEVVGWGLVVGGLGLVVFGLGACGGDDKDPVGVAPPVDVVVDGQVALPAGCTACLDSLVVVGADGVVPVGGDGRYTVRLPDDTGRLAVVRVGGGPPLLLGWVGPASSGLDARSTAEVLAWFGLGSWLLPVAAQNDLRERIGALGEELDALEAAVAAEAVAQPGGLATPSAGIHDALAATVAALGGPDKGLLIEPAGERSGVAVLNQGGINRVTLKNSYRRRVWVSIDRTSWVDAADASHDVDEPALTFEMDPVEGYAGVIGTIGGYFTGDIAYTPVETDPIELHAWTGAKYTVYDVITGGMGVVPPDAEDALTAAQTDAIEYTALKTVVWDFFLPLILNIVATAGEMGTIERMGLDEDMVGDIASFIDYCSSTVPDLYGHVAEGNAVEALHDLWGTFTGTDEFQNIVYDLVRGIFMRLGVERGLIGEALDATTRYLNIIGWIDIYGGFVDARIMAEHIARSEVADRWEIKVTSPLLHIEPREASLNVYASQQLTLVIDDDTGGDLEGAAFAYHWSTEGEHGTLVNPAHPTDTSNDFVTSHEYVHYVADVGTAGQDTVRCELLVTLGGVDTRVGEAACALEVYRREVVLPDTLYTCPDGRIHLDPDLEPGFDDGGVVWWHWTNLSAPGRLWNQGYEDDWVSRTREAIFDDETGGQGNIRCIANVSYDGGTTMTPVDTARALIIVADLDMFYGTTQTIPTWDWVHNMCGCRILYAFEIIPGVIRYNVYGHSFNDPYYYGTEYRTAINILSPPPGAIRTADRIMIGLSSGGGNCDPNDPPSYDDLCGWYESRFAGAIWEITPDCEY